MRRDGYLSLDCPGVLFTLVQRHAVIYATHGVEVCAEVVGWVEFHVVAQDVEKGVCLEGIIGVASSKYVPYPVR